MELAIALAIGAVIGLVNAGRVLIEDIDARKSGGALRASHLNQAPGKPT